MISREGPYQARDRSHTSKDVHGEDNDDCSHHCSRSFLIVGGLEEDRNDWKPSRSCQHGLSISDLFISKLAKVIKDCLVPSGLVGCRPLPSETCVITYTV